MTLYILYVFLLLFSLVPYLVREDLSLFLASATFYSIFFYYLHRRVQTAESANLTISENPSANDIFQLVRELSGGLKKVLSMVLLGSLAAIAVLLGAYAL